MEKEFVSHELALILKALGFKERVLTYYEDGKPKLHTAIEGWDFNSSFLTCVSRPTYSQAFRRFRKKYDLHYVIVKAESWFYTINGCNTQEGFNTYEEAELACLDKLIEIVEQKK